MSITRSMFKKSQKEQQQKQTQQKQTQQKQQTLNNIVIATHGIDFIDASIEWRKNKVKKESCVFEYISI